MKNIKQIFLDLDGPLLDGKERHYYCYQYILRSHGFLPINIEEYWRLKRAGTNRKELLRQSSAEGIYEEYMHNWLALIESPESLLLDKVQTGAIDIMTRWKSIGITISLVTMRRDREALDDQLVRTNLRPYLDAVVVCDDVKNKARAVQNSISINEIENNALWVGDTEADYEAATALGCDIILVENGLRSRNYLSKLKGACIVDSISAIEFI